MNLIKDLILGISKKLMSFNHTIYVDEVRTKLDTPCFIIQLIDHSNVRFPSNRFKQDFPIQIAFIPDTRTCSQVNFEIYEMISELNILTEMIELNDGSLILGKDVNHTVENNVLYFYITYSTFVKIVDDDLVYMSELEQVNGVEIDE